MDIVIGFGLVIFTLSLSEEVIFFCTDVLLFYSHWNLP